MGGRGDPCSVCIQCCIVLSINEGLNNPAFLRNSFEWYILTKQLKIRNTRLQGFVGADAAWRRAMDSQQKFLEKSQSREDEFVLRRDAYRAIFVTPRRLLPPRSAR